MAIIFLKADFLGWIILAYLTAAFNCPANMQLEQADGTSWMGMYALEYDGYGHWKLPWMMILLKILLPNSLNILY